MPPLRIAAIRALSSGSSRTAAPLATPRRAASRPGRVRTATRPRSQSLTSTSARAASSPARLDGVQLVVERDHERVGLHEPLQQRAELGHRSGQVAQPFHDQARDAPGADLVERVLEAGTPARRQRVVDDLRQRPAARLAPDPDAARGAGRVSSSLGERDVAEHGRRGSWVTPVTGRSPAARGVTGRRGVSARSAGRTQAAMTARPTRITSASRIVASVSAVLMPVGGCRTTAAATVGTGAAGRGRAAGRRGSRSRVIVWASPRPVRGRPCLI